MIIQCLSFQCQTMPESVERMWGARILIHAPINPSRLRYRNLTSPIFRCSILLLLPKDANSHGFVGVVLTESLFVSIRKRRMRTWRPLQFGVRV